MRRRAVERAWSNAEVRLDDFVDDRGKDARSQAREVQAPRQACDAGRPGPSSRYARTHLLACKLSLLRFTSERRSDRNNHRVSLAPLWTVAPAGETRE